MARRPIRSLAVWLRCGGLVVLALSGCDAAGRRAKLTQENETLRRDNERLERTVQQRDGTIALLSRQIEDLKGFDPDRPADLFAPVKIEIASLSGGVNYDGRPGDDGVTVYLRPRDTEGHVVKVPGRITIQLLDGAKAGSQRVLGVYRFDDPEKLRQTWLGRFATQHYTLRCPFPPDTRLPQRRRVTVHAEFVDYLTGATLTAVKEVAISLPDT